MVGLPKAKARPRTETTIMKQNPPIPQPIPKRTTSKVRIPPISKANKDKQPLEPKELITLDFTPVEAKYTEQSRTPRPPARAKPRPRTETNTKRILGDPIVVKALAQAKRDQKKVDTKLMTELVNKGLPKR